MRTEQSNKFIKMRYKLLYKLNTVKCTNTNQLLQLYHELFFINDNNGKNIHTAKKEERNSPQAAKSILVVA